MMTVSEIIAMLGKPAKVARETGIPLTTIASWRSANFIPDWRRPAILAMAKKVRAPITEASFPPKSERRSAAA